MLRFGTTVAAMEEALAERCRTVDSYEIDPPFLPEVEERQMQIDCDGFEFRGAERWVELVFRDDSLVMVWILTAAEEEPALLAAMTAAYGDPTHRGDDYFAWVDHLAALRRDKPEVLFYSGALAEVYGPWFDDNVGRAPPP